MPPCNRRPYYFICRGCYKDYTLLPTLFQGFMEICKACMASLTAPLLGVERVYLIVPGVRRARVGDEQMVYRWGEKSTIDAALRALPVRPSSALQLWAQFEPAQVARRHLDMRCKSGRCLKSLSLTASLTATLLAGCQTVEAVGPQGPQSFHGPGITLFDVSSRDVPEIAHEVMRTMFWVMCVKRRRNTATHRTYWPFPNNPSHCGGVVEFRFLSF